MQAQNPIRTLWGDALLKDTYLYSYLELSFAKALSAE